MLDRLLALLRPGGLLVADNVLWNGEVIPGYVRDRKYSEEDTAAIVAFSKRIATDPRLYTSFLQVGDGVSVSVKLTA
jgi:O-methyltransferase